MALSTSATRKRSCAIFAPRPAAESIMLIVLSHYQAASLLAARPEAPTHVTTSLDLNLNTTTVPVTATGVTLPDGQQLAWEVVEEIAANENACYHVRDNG